MDRVGKYMNQSVRLLKFESFKHHLMHGKIWKKLSKKELELCRQFILDHDHLDQDNFAYYANRWLLDKEKPRNYSTMWALVFQSNSR